MSSRRKNQRRVIVSTILLIVGIVLTQTLQGKAETNALIKRENRQGESTFFWTTAILISNESTLRSLRPGIAVDTADNLHIIWQDMTDLGGVGTDDDIFYKRWNATTEQWSATEVLSPSGTLGSSDPRITADEYGNIHLIWKDKTNILDSGSDSDIFYRYWNISTNSWSAIELVSFNSTGEVYSMDLAAKGGKVYVAWDDITNYLGNGPDEDILFAMRYPNGTWTAAETVSSVSDGNSRFPDVIIDENENVHLCWDDTGDYAGAGTDTDIFYRMKNGTTGLWSTTEVISSTSSGTSERVKLVIDNEGNRFIVWTDDTSILGAGNDDDIFYRVWDASIESWSAVNLLSNSSTGNSNVPAVVLDSKNIVHVVWFDTTDLLGAGADQDIFYRNYNFTSKEWSEYHLLTTSTGDSWRPEIAIDSKNQLHVVYQDRTINLGGSGNDIDIFYTIGHEKVPSPFLVIVDKPQDITYFYQGGSSNTLTWTVSDINITNPSYTIYRDGVLQESGSWITDEPIRIIIGDLEIGNYTYHFEASDGWGEQVEDDVVVIILAKETLLGRAARNALIGLTVGATPVAITALTVYLVRKRKKKQ